MFDFAHKQFGLYVRAKLARAAITVAAFTMGCAAAFLITFMLARVQHAQAAAGQSLSPPMPAGVEASITITLFAANTPTQTTLISVTNPTTAPAAIGVNFYKGLAANNQLACSLGPDILLAGSTHIYTVTETPGCANQTFSGDAVLGASQSVTATAVVQRVTTHYVAPNADCGNASPCYATPQAAAVIADTGDTVKVAQGVYTSQAFQVLFLNKGLTLTGGYTKTDWTQAFPFTQPVLLDGQNNPGQRVVQVVATGGSTLTLDGIVVRNGNLRSETNSMGAGIHVLSGTVVIRNSQIMSNAAASGAGVYSLGALVISGTRFVGNEASTNGPGAALHVMNASVTIHNSVFSLNRFITGTRPVPSQRGAIDVQNSALTVKDSVVESTVGAGIYLLGGSLNLFNSVIRNNAGSGIGLQNTDAEIISNTIEFNGNTTYEGGGISVNAICVGQLNLANNVIRSNSAAQGGGLGGRVGTLTAVNNLFQNNVAQVGGGALQLQKDSAITCTTPPSASLQNNKLLGNRADKASAILIDNDYRVQATNEVLANNVTSGFQTAAVHVASGHLDLRHGTLVGNGRYAISTGTGSAALTNTIVATHSVAGLAGNITSQTSLFFGNGSSCSNGATCINDRSGDPRFFWPLVNDYHLCQNSAAIDLGVNAGVNTDFEGEVRPQVGGIDIGADEWNETLCRRIRGVFLPVVTR